MKLVVSAWYPYQHQANAFQQLVGKPSLERIALEIVSSTLQNDVVGPYISLSMDDDDLPLLGLPSIVEYFHRHYPEKALFPDDIVLRGHARAFATMIEERFTRFCVADISSHTGWKRPTWNSASSASELVITTPPDLEGLVKISEHLGFRYLAADTPCLADALMAALWWTLEDQGRLEELEKHGWLKTWHERNCTGLPFYRLAAA
ncbi:hypothetical protein [Sphingosinicella xenopeptidilytica]|uniref:Glutathione S-transferase n=1 Tax=Sphingosinicella xenopeptidilytica TaxID=364098 RepID=A0ABW3C512_SPHXN